MENTEDKKDKSDFNSSEEGLIKLRNSKLDELRDLDYDPFAINDNHGENLFKPAENYQKIQFHRDNFNDGDSVTLYGRVTSRRDMGGSQFFDLSDFSGRFQCFLNKKNVSEREFYIYRNLVDLGDWLSVNGEMFTTKLGEPTIRVKSITVISKSLRPLPDKWHGLANIEQRYRQRYLDVISNENSRNVFINRSRVISEIRNFLTQRDFMEVETPMFHDMAGGAAAKPFKTHHNALNMPLYLRIAPELYLKRLLVGGFTKIFELNRNFRNEGISRRHNPEFTMLEIYEAFSDYKGMSELLEEMICHLAEKITGSLKLPQYDPEGNVLKEVNLARPWKREKYEDLIKNIDSKWFEYSLESKKDKCKEWGVEISPEMSEFEITQQVFEKLIEEKTIDPLFVTHLPKELVPLAKENKTDPTKVDVYELIINGQEISPGYSEQNDPAEQRKRFMEQVGSEIQNLDEDFLLALEHGMPPTGGAGVGIDRLIIFLTGAHSIRDVILFPQLKNNS